jgi:hypothetical protein
MEQHADQRERPGRAEGHDPSAYPRYRRVTRIVERSRVAARAHPERTGQRGDERGDDKNEQV